MRILTILIGFFLFTFSCKSLKTEDKTPQKISFISQDKLGNIYQISDMKIVKYSNKLDTIISNSIFNSGEVSSLDTRNPLQLMLFYKQQQEVILLDNTLSKTNKIKLNFFEWIDLACLSNRDNAFWLYSKTTQSLIKTNSQGKVVSRYKNIAQLIKKDINPIQLIEFENSVYLFDPNQGLFIFDLFGNYVKRIQLENAEIVRFYQKKIFFRVKNSVFSYDLINFDKTLVFSANHYFDDFVITPSELIFIENNQLVHRLNYKK